MAGKAGDRIIVESEQVGQAAREGEILEVHEGQAGPSYVVRWSNGHQSVFRPGSGSARILPHEEQRPA